VSTEPSGDRAWLASIHREIEHELAAAHDERDALIREQVEARARIADADALRGTWAWKVAAAFARLAPRAGRRRKQAVADARAHLDETRLDRPTRTITRATRPGTPASRTEGVALFHPSGVVASQEAVEDARRLLAHQSHSSLVYYGTESTSGRIIAAPAEAESWPPGRPYLAVTTAEATPAELPRVVRPMIGFTTSAEATATSRHDPVTCDERVSVIIPTRDRPDLLASAIASVELASWPGVEVVLVDNGTQHPEALAMLRSTPHRVVHDDGGFNFARLVNRGVSEASGDLIVLMNNDVRSTNGTWLAELAAPLADPSCAVAGALLTFPDGTVQHCGLTPHEGMPVHALLGQPAAVTPIGTALSTRDCWAVTGACLATRRTTWDDLGGFEVLFAHNYNDIDFCMRARQRGMRIVCSAIDGLIHDESASRGRDWDSTSAADWILFRARWQGELAAPDPTWPAGLHPLFGTVGD